MNLNEQRMALASLLDSIYTSMRAIDRKRNMRPSEKAMSISSLAMKATALKMAVDRIDAQLKAQAGEATPMGHYPEALGDQ